MKISPKKINKVFFSSLLTILPLQQLSLQASEILIANGDQIEEIKAKKVTKNGKLVVKFCNELSDLSGYVEVEKSKFKVSDADVISGKKLVWNNTNLSKTKGDTIKTSSLFSEGSSIVAGNCGVGILPFIFIGAGLAIGGSGGSSSSTSN